MCLSVKYIMNKIGSTCGGFIDCASIVILSIEKGVLNMVRAGGLNKEPNFRRGSNDQTRDERGQGTRGALGGTGRNVDTGGQKCTQKIAANLNC